MGKRDPSADFGRQDEIEEIKDPVNWGLPTVAGPAIAIDQGSVQVELSPMQSWVHSDSPASGENQDVSSVEADSKPEGQDDAGSDDWQQKSGEQ